MGFREIEDVERIIQLGRRLEGTLSAQCLTKETRTIGYPSGHENREVTFLAVDDDEPMWYAHWLARSGSKMVTLFGHGVLGEGKALSIDVQFNYPVVDFHRRLGAAFLEDTETGEVVLGHRGIVTLGQRVRKDVLFEAMAADVVEAATSRSTNEYLLVAALDSETLINDLSQFSRRLRQTVRSLGAEPDMVDDDAGESEEDEEVGNAGSEAPESNEPHSGIEGLRKYFEEFSGAKRAYKSKKSFPVSHHGKVVHALHAEMSLHGQSLKSRAIDLVTELSHSALVFEVKTRADTQSIYTAIGQLSIHSPCVETILGKATRKVLVVPERPLGHIAKVITEVLGVHTISYSISSKGKVTLTGLQGLFD